MVNKVILLGNLGLDPEVRHLESGSVVARIRLATSEAYKDREGNRIENTEWHDLEMWDGLAKVAEQYLRQGDTIYVEGKIKSNTWQDDQGNNRKNIRIRVLKMNMVKRMDSNDPIRPLSATGQQQNNGHNPNVATAPVQPKKHQQPAPAMEEEVDDLPF